MSLREQRIRSLEMGSELRDDLCGEDLEFTAKNGTQYTLSGVMSGVVERNDLGEGGLIIESDGQVRIRKDLAAVESFTPLIGMLVRRVSGGKVYRVDAVTEHDGSSEWRLDVNKI